MKKLSFSFLKKLKYDSTLAANNQEKLKELQNLAKEMMAGEKTCVHEDHYLYHIAKKVHREIRGTSTRKKREGQKQLRVVKKKEKELEKEKEVAHEKAGTPNQKRAA